MKDTRKLQEQIAEMTEEQKNNMGKIYKKYVLSIVLVFCVGILIALGLFAEASIREGKAKEKHNRIQAQIELNEQTNEYDFSLFDESSNALDEYYDMKQQKNLSLVIGSGIAFFGVLITYFIFKRKYPYFSEKKYNYLKKMEKNQG